MKILLNEDVYNLGEEGDVREVKRGYARNYLFPRGLAVLYSRANIAVIEQRRAAIEKRKEEKRKKALGLKERIEELVLSLSVPAGTTGRLFGSVTNANIAEELEKEGISIERKKIEIPDHHIKEAGEYTVRIRLYASEIAELTVKVNQTSKQSETADSPDDGGTSHGNADVPADEKAPVADEEESDWSEDWENDDIIEEEE